MLSFKALTLFCVFRLPQFDTLKYTLKKLESLLYELQLAGPAALREDEPEPVAEANGAKAEDADA